MASILLPDLRVSCPIWLTPSYRWVEKPSISAPASSINIFMFWSQIEKSFFSKVGYAAEYPMTFILASSGAAWIFWPTCLKNSAISNLTVDSATGSQSGSS